LHTQAYLETSFPMTLIHFNFTSCRIYIYIYSRTRNRYCLSN